MVEQILERIGLGLESRGVPYMIIGGQAVLLYGEPRLTGDVDVTLGVGPERLPEIQAWASASGWRVLAEAPAEFVQKTMVLPCLEPQSGVRIDFIFSFSAYERQAIERARPVQVGKTLVRFASTRGPDCPQSGCGASARPGGRPGNPAQEPQINLQYVEH